MEDVLDIYSQPYDPRRPQVCMDERPCQLVGDILAPMPMKPDRPLREDCEYERRGTCSIFIAFEPLAGRRWIRVEEHRTRIDYARFMKELVDVHYPDAECVRLVQDNLNTHSGGSFYEAFTPEEAFNVAKKFECHHTPKKGSWLNMAEIELSALSKQCLDRRVPDIQTLRKEVGCWERERNRHRRTVSWRFTKNDARIKLEKFYPVKS